MKKTITILLLIISTLFASAQSNTFRDSTNFEKGVRMKSRTANFFYKKGATPGYVLTAVDTFGKAAWQAETRDTLPYIKVMNGDTVIFGIDSVSGFPFFGTKADIFFNGYINPLKIYYAIGQIRGDDFAGIQCDSNGRLTLLTTNVADTSECQINMSPDRFYIENSLALSNKYLLDIRTKEKKIGFFNATPVTQPTITSVQYAALATGEQLIADALILLGLLKIN